MRNSRLARDSRRARGLLSDVTNTCNRRENIIERSGRPSYRTEKPAQARIGGGKMVGFGRSNVSGHTDMHDIITDGHAVYVCDWRIFRLLFVKRVFDTCTLRTMCQGQSRCRGLWTVLHLRGEYLRGIKQTRRIFPPYTRRFYF